MIEKCLYFGCVFFRILGMKVVGQINVNFYPNKKSEIEPQKTQAKKGESVPLKSFEERFSEVITRMKNDPYNLTANVYNMGRLLKDENGKITDEKIDFIINSVHELLENPNVKRSEKERHINATNILYSSLLKIISQDNVLLQQVSPEAYRRVIDESLLMYKKYPLKDTLDVRHIIGRYVSLKDMSAFVIRKHGYLPKAYKALKWTSSEQLDFAGVLEEAYKNYEKSNAAFTIKSAASNFDANREDSYKELKENYERNIIKTMEIFKQELASMLSEPRKNFFDIKSAIEVIHTYFDKMPSDTDLRFPAYKILYVTNLLEDKFYSLLKKKV